MPTGNPTPILSDIDTAMNHNNMATCAASAIRRTQTHKKSTKVLLSILPATLRNRPLSEYVRLHDQNLWKQKRNIFNDNIRYPHLRLPKFTNRKYLKGNLRKIIEGIEISTENKYFCLANFHIWPSAYLRRFMLF